MSEQSFDRAEFIRYFKDEADELLQLFDAELLQLETLVGAPSTEPELVNSLFRALHTLKGSAAMLELHEVSTLAHKLENACDMLRRDRIPLSEPLIDFLFEGRDLLTALVVASTEGSTPQDPSPFIERLEAFTAFYEEAAIAPAGESERVIASEEEVEAFESEIERLLREEGFDQHIEAARVAARLPIPEMIPERRKEPRPARARTIRVDIARLDVLLDLVGELVINRTRISEIVATLARRSLPQELAPLIRELADAASLLARTTAEMQDGVMRARMVPIGGVFERFPRAVRDMAKARNKEVEVAVAGAETALDKTIVDEIGEPLMHLVRNAVDHGIESPDVRIERGKPPTGTISLRAFHEGKYIVIQIADDGGGIDFERVRARAITLGLIPEGASPAERELLDVIFTPGFSTAQTVSDVSGRGVGMDVVKLAISRLGGTLGVESELGQGTTFTIRLPLTLAIIHALLTRIGDGLYAIPLDAVVESQRFEAGQILSKDGIEAVAVRDRFVPLVRTGEFFEARNAARNGEKVMVVVVAVGGRFVGLIVDEFLGDQEIVIKPLSEAVGHVPGISGGTILGNGAIALIVDVPGLVRSAALGAKTGYLELSET